MDGPSDYVTEFLSKRIKSVQFAIILVAILDLQICSHPPARKIGKIFTIKNGIRDACSTADIMLSIVIRYPLLSIVAYCCPLLSIVIHCYPLLSTGLNASVYTGLKVQNL